MKRNLFKNDLLLLLTAAIWGSAFVAQRMGMDHMGPYWFNGLRFFLGALSLFPLILKNSSWGEIKGKALSYLAVGALAGTFLFAGASFQQMGMVYSDAGNAGFITGLYVVLVPISGIFFKQRTVARVWISAVIALLGLYFLSINPDLINPFSEKISITLDGSAVESGTPIMSKGDLLILISAFFWTAHVQIIARFAPKMNSLVLSAIQFLFCSVASLLVGLFTESISWPVIQSAMLPIAYGGIMSVGVAYTLQVVAQQKVPPSHAVIILSLEGAFAALAGGFILGENFSRGEILGCILMFSAMLLAQIDVRSILRERVRKDLQS